MAVVEMSKLNLIALIYDRDKILNALQRTQATEIKMHGQTENTAPLQEDTEALSERLARGEAALEVLISRVENYNKENKIKSEDVGEVEIGYNEFIQSGENAQECEKLIEKLNTLLDKERELKSELASTERLLSSAEIYSHVNCSLHPEKTAHTVAKIGTVPVQQKDAFINLWLRMPTASLLCLPCTRRRRTRSAIFCRA